MVYATGQTSVKLAFLIFTVISSSCALFDRVLEHLPAHPDPPNSSPKEDSEFSYCDFESPCSWTLSNHSTGEDWYVTSPQQNRANRWGIQPVKDHSPGKSQGHFLLLKPSSTHVAAGRCIFHITSPVVLNSGPLCRLRFACYQPEPHTGNVSAFVKHDNDSDITPIALTPKERGGGRAEWEVLEAMIGQSDEPFRVTLQYSSCSVHEVGFLGIDSLELMDCVMDDEDLQLNPDCENYSFHCDSGTCIEQPSVCDFHTHCTHGEDEGFICSTLPLGSYCSFESDMCGWSVSNTQSSWKLVSVQQLTESTDLLGTTLQNTKGHFLFHKVRGHSDESDVLVQSPAFPPTISNRGCQLRFSLYLYGDFNGSIVLSMVENGTSSPPLVWKKSWKWKDSWQDVNLQITKILNGFYIKVQAMWTSGSMADIALDDISLSTGCFETDLNQFLVDKIPSRVQFTKDHNLDPGTDLDDNGPLPEPFASDVSLMTWLFTSCGASGPLGPTQAQCDSAYRNSNISVVVEKEAPFKGVQMWRVPVTQMYKISAYGAGGGKGAKNHNKRSNGVFISAIFKLEAGDILYILIGQQGEDACPGRNSLTQSICLGESSVIEDGLDSDGSALEWAGGGGGGGGATYIYRMENEEAVPLLIAAGGGGKAYLEDPESSLEQMFLEQYENEMTAVGVNGKTGAAGGGGGWNDSTSDNRAGRSAVEGGQGGTSCPQALEKLGWVTSGGFGGGGGACTAGGGGGGYRGGDAPVFDGITADGQDGVSFVHPSGEIFLQPLAVMDSHGEAVIKVYLNCSHCQTQSCKRDEETKLIFCLCDNDEVLAPDNVTCLVVPLGSVADGPPSLIFILAVIASTVVTGVVLTCASLTIIYYRKKNHLHAVRIRLQSPEYKLSKIRSSTIMTDYNPNYCFSGKAASLSELKEVPRKNITLLRALGHGAFGEVYEGQVLGMKGDNTSMQVAIKTLPEICSEQDEMDFLMEALIMSKFNHQNIVRCIGVSLQILPRFILLELMTGGDMKSFLRLNRPRTNQPSSLSMLELLHMARDIALGCRYLEENHFIHRDIAARNCLLTCPGPDRVAKIGDFGMARDIYRASYYRKGGRAMLPVKWMPPEAFLEGIFTCKTDTWSFGVLLWEIFSLGYMPYPCKTNQEVLEFVTGGGRMDPPKSCPGPVYRIMTQCWQHCPEHRPNFTTILERINYCTQDPDVINTPLPVEYGPAVEEDGVTVICPEGSISMSPLLTAHVSQDGRPGIPGQPPQALKPCLQIQKPAQLAQEVGTYSETLEPCWADPTPGVCPGQWLQVPDQRPCSRSRSSLGSQKLKNKTKNLWNPTYGSWVLESFGRGKTALYHIQSMPPSCKPTSTPIPASATECVDPVVSDANVPTPTCPPPSTPPSPTTFRPTGPPSLASRKGAGVTGDSLAAVMDLAKLHSFPCGNVNYAYDEQSYATESLPVLAPKSAEPCTSSSASSSLAALGLATTVTHKPLVKRHASYGHEDLRRYTQPEKPVRDRDSGFSLSEDLSVTPV
ncbi:tyrosine-protein kinase receptor [Triplophysa rosa]|uniref:Tyrosine-protein kinase receptor n=1 Tax=Triplophysa rosa TaxID=992332 RepID=A0A9W7TSK9_TRIRA|nr:tyrosine-protein kinase receptor [Triplophysa rosa]KAI7804610.1 leukocyte tyrosine kinase protein [Triplophysa rosa]